LHSFLGWDFIRSSIGQLRADLLRVRIHHLAPQRRNQSQQNHAVITSRKLRTFVERAQHLITPHRVNVVIGLINGAMLIGGVVFARAFWSLYAMKETYGRDINFVEQG